MIFFNKAKELKIKIDEIEEIISDLTTCVIGKSLIKLPKKKRPLFMYRMFGADNYNTFFLDKEDLIFMIDVLKHKLEPLKEEYQKLGNSQ